MELITRIPNDRNVRDGSLDIDRLAKLYVEPTNRCNLDCRTCMRQGWEEGLGFMEFGLVRKDHGGSAMPFPGRPGFFSAASASRWAIRASSTWWRWPSEAAARWS